jgi:hypothetical protein
LGFCVIPSSGGEPSAHFFLFLGPVLPVPGERFLEAFFFALAIKTPSWLMAQDYSAAKRSSMTVLRRRGITRCAPQRPKPLIEPDTTVRPDEFFTCNQQTDGNRVKFLRKEVTNAG